MARIVNYWIILIALTGLTKWAAGQGKATPAQITIREVNARTGNPANFTCESHGIPLVMCLWERLGSDQPLNFNAQNTRPGQSTQPGYSYIGEGLEKGQCGLVISNVKDSDNGTWQCSLFTNAGAIYRGTVNLGILRKPDPPMFNPTVLAEILEEDPSLPGQSTQLKEITCYSAKGEPKPKFQWFIDDQLLTENLGPINETKQSTTNGEIVYTFQALRNHKFSYRDNGKKLRCVVVHDALTENDKKEISTDIRILFRPRAADGNPRGSYPVQAELGEEKIVSLNVSSNPRPTIVEWDVDGKIIKEGQSSEKYDALLIKEVETGVWEASLRIKGVEEDDLTKNFKVKLANAYGTADFSIALNSSSAGSGGLNAGGILGIILAVVVILILLAVIVVYTRTRGILCFKGDDGTASEKERMDGGSTGVGAGAAEEKPSRRLSSRLSAFYENLMAKKKDKTAVVDEEAGKDKEPKEKEPIEGEAQASDEKDKKPDDIVYAELDLARSGGEPRPEVRVVDDKTEYAEIVGVVAAKTVDETSPKKSPQGSPKK